MKYFIEIVKSDIQLIRIKPFCSKRELYGSGFMRGWFSHLLPLKIQSVIIRTCGGGVYERKHNGQSRTGNGGVSSESANMPEKKNCQMNSENSCKLRALRCRIIKFNSASAASYQTQDE